MSTVDLKLSNAKLALEMYTDIHEREAIREYVRKIQTENEVQEFIKKQILAK